MISPNPKHPTVEAALEHGGLSAALRLLNLRTSHRLTGVFQFKGELIENIAIFDRQNEKAPVWPTVPASRAYCSMARADNQSFILANSQTDARVEGHPSRDLVLSYCGVPLRGADGAVFGTLCHFDHQPILFTDIDIEFLEHASVIIARHLAL